MSVLLALVCVNISQPSALAADNLVVNGSFEEPVAESVYGPLDWKPSLKGWELSEGPAIEIQGGVAGAAYDGKQLVELDSTDAVTGIYQDIPTKPGKTYKLTFAFSPRPNVADNKLNVSWGDTTIAQLEKNGEGLTDTDWQVYTYYLKATSDSTRLSFDDLNETSDGLGTFIDAVSIEPFVCRLPGKDCEVIISSEKTFSIPVIIPIPEKAATLPLDLMLTQDLTSSFKDDLPNLKTVIPDLVKQLRAVQPNTNFGLASFTDKKSHARPAYAKDYYVYKTSLPLTKDEGVFEQAVAKLTIVGPGKDYPESSLSALMQVALRAESELGFRKDTRRVAIISTDAAYRQAGDDKLDAPNNGDAVIDPNEDYPSVAQAKQAINEANMVPIFLVTKDQIATYNGLVSQLGVGAVVELAANSSNLAQAVQEALKVVNQNLTLVAVNDDYGYVRGIDPDRFENVEPGSEVTTEVTFKYSGRGSGDDVTIRALGIGDLIVDVQVSL
jgi:hypothetical protein